MEYIIFIAILLMVANIPIYKRIFRRIFKDSEDFYDSVKYSFTPNLFSFFKGKYWEDRVGEAKLSFFIFCCIAVVVIELLIIKWAIVPLITK